MSDYQYSTPPRRRESRPISSMQFMFVGILAVGLLLALNLSDRIAEGQRIQADRLRVEREIEALEGTQAALQETLEWVQNPAYAEAWARREGKMIRPGEILVVPVPGGAATAVATVAPTPTQPPRDDAPAKWLVWWTLFFDGPPPALD